MSVHQTSYYMTHPRGYSPISGPHLSACLCWMQFFPCLIDYPGRCYPISRRHPICLSAMGFVHLHTCAFDCQQLVVCSLLGRGADGGHTCPRRPQCPQQGARSFVVFSSKLSLWTCLFFFALLFTFNWGEKIYFVFYSPCRLYNAVLFCSNKYYFQLNLYTFTQLHSPM